MPDRRSLLARLRPEDSRTPSGSLREDVLRGLRHMLRTRVGSSPATLGYGLPDLTDVLRSNLDTPSLVARALKQSIEAFEPRLVNVRVTHIPGETWEQQLRFEIFAHLVDADRKRSPLTFETRIDPSRQVMIR